MIHFWGFTKVIIFLAVKLDNSLSITSFLFQENACDTHLGFLATLARNISLYWLKMNPHIVSTKRSNDHLPQSGWFCC